VCLDRVVGREHPATHHDDSTDVPRIAGRGPAHRVGEVSRPVELRRGRIAHRAGYRERLARLHEQREGERRLLHGVRALHDDGAVDLVTRQVLVEHSGDLDELPEPKMRGRDEAPVDRLEIGNLLQLRGQGKDRRAIERRGVASGSRIWQGRDGPPGEDDCDAAHSSSAGPGSPGVTRDTIVSTSGVSSAGASTMRNSIGRVSER
jgi:hypothetical protein